MVKMDAAVESHGRDGREIVQANNTPGLDRINGPRASVDALFRDPAAEPRVSSRRFGAEPTDNPPAAHDDGLGHGAWRMPSQQVFGVRFNRTTGEVNVGTRFKSKAETPATQTHPPQTDRPWEPSVEIPNRLKIFRSDPTNEDAAQAGPSNYAHIRLAVCGQPQLN